MSRESLSILINCGCSQKTADEFHSETTYEQIQEYVEQSFRELLPKSYRIKYYDSTCLLFVDLQEQIQNGNHPFQNQSTNVNNCPQLFVVTDQELSTASDDTELEYSSTTDDLSNDQLANSSAEDLSTRLSFLLDVKSHQRDIYKSDEFSIRSNEANGRIARVQGRKTPAQKMLQVLPKLNIPQTYLQSNVTLLVAIVFEKIENGTRFWYKYPHKGFLPEGYTKDTLTVNPITLNLDKNITADDTTYALNLHMITKWDKSGSPPELFYQCDEKKAQLLHTSVHDPNLPRLFCVLKRNEQIDWTTFCISDYIRSTKSSKRKKTIEVSDSIDAKQLKTTSDIC